MIRAFAVAPRFLRPIWTLVVAAALGLVAGPASAAEGACGQLAYTFQPDCYHPDGPAAPCRQTLQRLDLGPQIAVWIETADHTLVDTLMVTNLTAARGIGNRPGIWNFRSGPKFPYGKRWMSLPLWAYARGKLYDTVVMQDDREDWMGFHEAHSSKETYFCRPLMQQEVNLAVDAVTCPSPNFNSAKGKLVGTPSAMIPRSYYPPRNDLVTFVNQDCDVVGQAISKCTVSAASFSTLDDLDAVAAATPAYGEPYTRTWRIPANLPEGDYVLAVEVSKEYDTNLKHSHPGFDDVHGGLSSYGIDGNFGQPSVLYRVPIHLGGSTPLAAAVSQIAGYSSWPAKDPTPDAPGPVTVPLDGVVLPRDNTISTTVPGSGEQRLLEIDGPSGKGRVHVELQRCSTPPPPPMCDGGADAADSDGGCAVDGGAPETPAPMRCSPLPPPPGQVSELVVVATDGTSAGFEFLNASANGEAVEAYEIKYRLGKTMTVQDFNEATPAPIVRPRAPGSPGSFSLEDLKPDTQYVVGIRSTDGCDQHSEIAVLPFVTTAMKFTQLSGCFVATAAWGSALEPHVQALRHARDRLRPESPLFAAATDLYYRSGPAAAAVVQRSEVARAMARRVLGPFAGLAEALDGFLIRDPGQVRTAGARPAR
jgi:hypothetical protein